MKGSGTPEPGKALPMSGLPKSLSPARNICPCDVTEGDDSVVLSHAYPFTMVEETFRGCRGYMGCTLVQGGYEPQGAFGTMS
ncbi:hypothetical protein D3C75_1059330 [compost metagenome]